MKALLICPDQRTGVAVLAETAPLGSIPILGKSLVQYWLEQLVTMGAKEVLILAADRPNEVRADVGNGSRWGLRVVVQAEKREWTPDEARARYQQNDAGAWLPRPGDVVLMDHLPRFPQVPMTASYADWFAGTRLLLPLALTPDRIGVRELQAGVWVGLHAQIDPAAKLVAPCWIGEHAIIEGGATIGPQAVLENQVFIARGASVYQSVVGPKTFVGEFTEVRNSIACGGTLVNWERDSCLRVTDEFLLCSLERQRTLPAPSRVPAMTRLRESVGEMMTTALGESEPPR
jgi:NDP-sugar pyrophosphorylase family protein